MKSKIGEIMTETIELIKERIKLHRDIITNANVVIGELETILRVLQQGTAREIK